jgi:hypothetical protein
MSDDTESCGAVEYVPQWQEKIGWKLFPPNYVESPDLMEAHDCVHTTVHVEFSFLDRLRILFSGKVKVEVRTTTENLVGNCVSASIAFPKPPPWLERK